jgi:hypothetical protein
MNLLQEQIYCINHNKKNIIIDDKTFQIICLECQKEGKKGNENLKLSEEYDKYNLNENLNNVKANKEKSEKEKSLSKEKTELEYYCVKYPTEKALFYCDDCSVFIGAKSFALEHRLHNCSTPELMFESLGREMSILIKDLNDLKEQVNNRTSLVSELDNFFNSKFNDVKNVLNSFNQEISTELNKKSKNLNIEVEDIFNGIDSEVENYSQRLNHTKKRANKILEEVKEICDQSNIIKTDEKMCQYKKEKEGILDNNRKFFNDIQIFMTENVENTRKKTEAGMAQFIKKCNAFQKNLEIYENSIVNTINSAIPNKCMRIRRFRRYFISNSRYLKTTSIGFSVSHSINLVGFCLCGLIDNNKTANPNIEFEVKIYELNSDQDLAINNVIEKKSNLLYESKISVPTIINLVDPVFQFYLNRTIQVNRDKKYIMIMNNLEKNSYIDMWTGEIIPEKSDMIESQTVTCNNSGVKFTFKKPNGIQCDFDEFSYGLVSDLIFSQLD